MSETKKFEIEFTELCDEYEVDVANFNEFYNKVVALAIQVQAPVIKKIAEDMVILLDEYNINGMLQPSIIDKTLKIFGQKPYYYNEDGE